jgi:hypothetical protein
MPTTQVRPENQSNLLQLIESFSLVHQRKALSSLCAAWWSWWLFHRLKQSRNGDQVLEKQVSYTTTAPNKTENQIMMLQLMESFFPIHQQRALSSSCSP